MRNINYITPPSTAHSLSAVGLLIAGLVHLVLTPEHALASSMLGLGFLGVAIVQLSFGLLFLTKRMQDLEPAALLVTVASLTIYTISRTLGLSFEHSHVDQPGYVELLCKSAELLVVCSLTFQGLRQRITHGEDVPCHPVVHKVRHPLSLAALGVLAAVCLVSVAGQLASSQGHSQAADHQHSTTSSATHNH